MGIWNSLFGSDSSDNSNETTASNSSNSDNSNSSDNTKTVYSFRHDKNNDTYRQDMYVIDKETGEHEHYWSKTSMESGEHKEGWQPEQSKRSK